jgi:sugar phosphate isomerase/epimerase
MKLALSTMWSQQDIFATDISLFALRARELGYDAVEISYVIPEEPARLLATCNVLPVTSVHQPCPRLKLPDGRWSDEANLASPDEKERQLAVGMALNTIDFAAEAGATHVVVHQGFIDDPELIDLNAAIRGAAMDGKPDPELVERMRQRRAQIRDPWVEAAARSFLEMAAHGKARGITLGLEARYHFHEIPLADEALAILEQVDQAYAGSWADTGHIEVLDRLGFIRKEEWYDALGSLAVGCHLSDVDGIADHRAPGNGDVDWALVAAHLPAAAVRTCEINQLEPAEAVARAPALLREWGVVQA